MTTELSVDSKDVQRRLSNVLALTSRPQSLMREIAATLHELTNENFETEGNGTWPALKHREGKPLQDTRRLYNSITERSTANSAEVATNVIYAPLQQFGAKQGQFGKSKRNTPLPWGNIPAREYFPIDDNFNINNIGLARVMETLTHATQNALK